MSDVLIPEPGAGCARFPARMSEDEYGKQVTTVCTLLYYDGPLALVLDGGSTVFLGSWAGSDDEHGKPTQTSFWELIEVSQDTFLDYFMRRITQGELFKAALSSTRMGVLTMPDGKEQMLDFAPLLMKPDYSFHSDPDYRYDHGDTHEPDPLERFVYNLLQERKTLLT